MTRLVTYTNLEVLIDVDVESFERDCDIESSSRGGGPLPFPYLLASKRGGLMGYVTGVCHGVCQGENFEVDTLVSPIIVTVYHPGRRCQGIIAAISEALGDLAPWVTIQPLKEET